METCCYYPRPEGQRRKSCYQNPEKEWPLVNGCLTGTKSFGGMMPMGRKMQNKCPNITILLSSGLLLMLHWTNLNRSRGLKNLLRHPCGQLPRHGGERSMVSGFGEASKWQTYSTVPKTSVCQESRSDDSQDSMEHAFYCFGSDTRFLEYEN